MKKYRIELTMACLLLVCFYLLSRQAAVISVNQTERGTQKAASPLILVDAGHGGSDPGMIGVGGLEEKGINLSISLLLRDTLEKSGYSVIMTREEDKGLYDSSAANKKAQDMQVFYYESSVEGKKLAEAVQSSLNDLLEVDRPREVKGNTSYYLLKRSSGTLVIVECGFLTNPEEAQKLQTKEYQEKVAAAVSEGIRTYLNAQ